MNRLSLYVVAAVLVSWSAGNLIKSAVAAEPSPRPNIVVFLADDLGYADVPWHGTKYSMPNLDALAKQSLRLEAHYVNPMCSPTRAAFLSGRYASRFGVTGAQNERAYPFDQATLASVLKGAGYATALTGKWHLGSKSEWGPNKFGFDHAYGSLAGGVGPYDHHYKKGEYTETWHRNGELITEEGHVTDLVAREAVAFVAKQSAAKPFFLYIPFTAVHIPIDEPAEWLERNLHVEDEGERLHAACASHMDDAVGRVLAALERAKLRDNTIVMFFSDNGGHQVIGNSDPKYPGTYPEKKVGGHNTPLRGYKGQLYEGGVRSATLVSWPGMIQPGRKSDGPVHVTDWLPTFAVLAGYRPDGAAREKLRWDGTDLAALLFTDSSAVAASPRGEIYCLGVGGRNSLLRQGDWKLIIGERGDAELYNLAADVGEKTNIAAQEPQRVAAMSAALQAAAKADYDRMTPETAGKTKNAPPKKSPPQPIIGKR